MTLKDFLVARNVQHRRIRHLAFWILYSIAYYVQSIVPVEQPLHTALYSLLSFFPACVVSVYSFMGLWVHLGRKKQYVLFILALLLVATVVFAINYAGAFLFFFGTCNCDVWQISRLQLIGLDMTNSLHALSTAGLVVGFSITKEWMERERENQELCRLKLLREIKLQRTKLHPQLVLDSLKQLGNEICSGSSEAPAMVLSLSEVLSYLLYESSLECIPLSSEIQMMENLLFLEYLRSKKTMSFELKINCVPDGKLIKPLALFSSLRDLLDESRDQHNGQSIVRFTLSDSSHGLSLEKTHAS